MKNSILVLILLLSCGCSNFLSEYSQDMVRAKTIADFDEVLLGSVYIPIENALIDPKTLVNRKALSFLNIEICHIRAMTWASTVANAAPFIPMSKP